MNGDSSRASEGLFDDVETARDFAHEVADQGFEKMSDHVAAQIHTSRDGRASLEASFADARSGGSRRARSGAEATFHADQYYEENPASYSEAFAYGVPQAVTNAKNSAQVEQAEHGEAFFADVAVGPDEQAGVGKMTSALDARLFSTGVDLNPGGVFPIVLKYQYPVVEKSLAAVVGNPNTFPFVNIGPIVLVAKADVVLFSQAGLYVEFDVAQDSASEPGGLRKAKLQAVADFATEGYVAVALNIIIAEAGVKAAIRFVDTAVGVDYEATRSFEVFTTEAEANALAPNLWSLGGCDEKPTGSGTIVCDYLEAASGKPTNGLTRIEQTVSEIADVYFLKAYLAAYARLGPCPFCAKWSTILAETKPAFFKQGGAERKIHSIVTNQQIACGSSLNLVPASWDREACRELPF